MQLELKELAAIIPLVNRLGLIESFVALQADQRLAGRQRDALRELRLAGPGGAFDEYGLMQLRGQVHDGSGCGVCQVAGPVQSLKDMVNWAEIFRHAISIANCPHACSWRRRATGRPCRATGRAPSLRAGKRGGLVLQVSTPGVSCKECRESEPVMRQRLIAVR